MNLVERLYSWCDLRDQESDFLFLSSRVESLISFLTFLMTLEIRFCVISYGYHKWGDPSFSLCISLYWGLWWHLLYIFWELQFHHFSLTFLEMTIHSSIFFLWWFGFSKDYWIVLSYILFIFISLYVLYITFYTTYDIFNLNTHSRNTKF